MSIWSVKTSVGRWREYVYQRLEAIVAGGGTVQLSDLSDVGTTTPTNKNALMADGDSWESRALIEADISDLTHVTGNATHTGDVTGATGLTIAAKAVDVAMLADGTDGELISWGTDGVATVVGVGTNNHILTSNGAGNPPTFQAAGAATSSWVELVSEAPSVANTWAHTWVEATYSNILVVVDGIVPGTDAVSIYLKLGSADGATISETSGDYDGIEMVWEGTAPAWAGLADTDKIRLAPSIGTGTGEVFNASIDIKCTEGSNTGALVYSQVLYKNSAANHRAFEVKAFMDANPVAVDTVQLSLASGDFTTAGNIAVYGLKR